MKIYYFLTKFIPRIPVPKIKNPYGLIHTGDFILFAKKKRIFEDILTTNIIRIHFSNPLQVTIEDEQWEQLHTAFTKITTNICYRVNSSDFNNNDLIVLPQFVTVNQQENESFLKNTLKWCEIFNSDDVLSNDYIAIAEKLDKKSNGRNLMSFVSSHGSEIDRFFEFVENLKIPVQDFIDKTEPCNEIEDRQLNTAIFFCTKFSYRLIESLIQVSTKNKVLVFKRPVFGYSVDSVCEPKGKKYKEIFFKKYRSSDLNEELPLISVVGPFIEFDSPDELMNNLTKYPQHYSLFQMNLEYIYEHKLAIIQQILQRIPEDFTSKLKNDKLMYPIEIMTEKLFPRTVQSLLYLFNDIFDQIKPMKLGDEPINVKMQKTIRKFTEKFNYTFKNWHIVWQFLIDPSYYFRSSQFIHNYERLEYLGDTVLDLLFGISVFNGCYNYANEGLMSELKIAFVKNRTFSKISEILDLKSLLCTSTPTNYDLGKKGSADLFEALFGAILLDSNISKCIEIFKKIIEEYQEEFLETVRITHADKVIKYITKTSVDDYMNLVMPKKVSRDHVDHEKLSKILELDINPSNVTQFTVALTHSSVGKYNYERIEFIGDLIVKYSLIVSQMEAFPNATESGMSIASSFLKSNDFLGKRAYKIGLIDLLSIVRKENSSEDAAKGDIDESRTPKYYGDVFEAITAAIAGTFGIITAMRFVIKNSIGKEWPIDSNHPNLPIKVQLLYFLQNEFKIIPNFITIHVDNMHYSFCDLNNVRLPVFGADEDKIVSQNKLATEMMNLINQTDVVEKLKERLANESEDEERNSNFVIF